MPLPRTVVAVDIGGTKTAAALVDEAGAILHRTSAPTRGTAGRAAILEDVATAVRHLVSTSGLIPVGVGVGSAGVIDARTGFVLGATDVLAGWAGTDLRADLARSLDLPVAVIGDVQAHALGERAFGAGRGCDRLLAVAVGTGVGGALISGGRIEHGAHAAAGHVGHVPSSYAGKLPCTCGGRGHLEAIASGPALAAEYERRTGVAVSDLRDLAVRARSGEATALGVLELGGTAVGSAIGGLVNVFDPEVVVVGGGVASVGEVWWDALVSAVHAELLPALRDVPVRRSTLGGDAALLGAAWIAWELGS